MNKNYYLFKSGRLQRKDDSLIFYYLENEEEKHTYIPIQDVDSLYCFGEMDFNTKLINFLAQQGILVHFFNYYGFYTGSFYPKESQVSGFLLVKQVQHYVDSTLRLTLAKNIIESAVYVILTNLKYYQNKERNLENQIKTIQEWQCKIQQADSIQSLMGIEGNIRSTYYSAFESIIIQDIDFKKRVKNPPDNMVNTLISFINMMVYTLCLSEIYKTQLNPTISFLHEPGERRFSLSLDIAEIFKPLIADRIIFSLLNKKQITEDDFEKESNGLYLKEKARKLIITTFDEKIRETVKHRKLNRSVSYRYIIRLELYRLIKHILGEEVYAPFKIYW